MTINAEWTDPDTVALKSLTLQAAEKALQLKRDLEDIFLIVDRNAITSEELGDDATVGGPVPKAAIWELLTFRDQYELLMNNSAVIAVPSFWHGTLGRMTKV